MSTVVAILGAESTGKTTLAQALCDALRGLGRDAVVVPEHLRAFCDAEGRTPRQEEQAAIADAQWRHMEAAAARAEIVLADTTPLMTAAYSELLFGDTILYAAALAQQRRCAVTLLTGLDLPWQADGLQRDGPHVRGPVDTLIRRALDGAQLPYAVVYGQGEARSAHALDALRRPLGLPSIQRPVLMEDTPVRQRMRCRECLQPDCEHLLRLLPDAS